MHKFIFNNLNKTPKSSTIYIEKKDQPNENIHLHDFTELAIIFKGRAKHIINNNENTIKAGDVFVVKGNTSHGYEDTQGLVICNIIYQEKDTYNFKKLPGFQTLFVLEPSFRIKYNYESMLNLNHKELAYLDNITDRSFYKLISGLTVSINFYCFIVISSGPEISTLFPFLVTLMSPALVGKTTS